MKVFPVIHFLTYKQALYNAELAKELGADGVFVIDMSGQNTQKVLKFYDESRAFLDSNFKVGINILGTTTHQAAILAGVYGYDMLWSDEQIFFESKNPENLEEIKKSVQLNAIELFTAVGFKYQKEDIDTAGSAYKAAWEGFIPTTSGSGTGVAADISKIEHIRNVLDTSSKYQKNPLALASGLTPDNIGLYKPSITHALVSTGVSDDFYNFDYELLKTFIERAR